MKNSKGKSTLKEKRKLRKEANRAENGDVDAQCNLERLYEIRKKSKGGHAIHWNQEAAENGDVKAQFNLATLYYKKKDLEDAFYWYREAAENGLLIAQNYLASMYKDGKGTV